MKRAMIVAVGATLMFGVAHAASKAEAEHAISAAAAKMKIAASLNNQWTPTVSTFKKAKKAAAEHDYAAAEAKAKKAEALAERSIEQARTQKHLWQHEVPR